MDFSNQRIKDLKDNLEKDFELLKELEDQKRYEEDPQKIKQIEQKLERIKTSIDSNKNELSSLNTKVDSTLALAMTEITFNELDIVTKGLLSMPINEKIDFTLISPTEKMSKNKLSHQVQSRIMIGLIKSVEVKKFIEHMAGLIPDFPSKLKAGFVTKYNQLKQHGLEGDILFEHLHNFASGNDKNYDLQTAGLAVLSYLFERCEIFEK